MMLILLKQRMFNWSANVPTLVSKSMCATYRETAGNCICLCTLVHHGWATNIVLSKICLLFFNMFLFCSSLISIVVQYVPYRGQEQGHLQSTGLLGRF